MNKYSLRNFIPTLLLIAIVPIAMSLVRPLFTQSNLYLWMNWNLFLGVVPLLIAWLYYENVGGKYIQGVWFILWLLFLPNSVYMITDFIHLADSGIKNFLWYDSLMLFCFAWVGILSWIYSTQIFYKRIKSKLFIPVITLLTAFGVYLGRYIRFNSWDILSKPIELIKKIEDILWNPLQYENLISFVVSFWVFLMFVFLAYTFMNKKKSPINL